MATIVNKGGIITQAQGLTGAVENREGYPILTYASKTVYPLDPSLDEIDIEDIAHALANICRYTGHVREFYSVAEHSIRVSWLIEEMSERFVVEPVSASLDGLLHDASEAYIGDVARPIKASGDVGALYQEAENRLMTLIAEKFNIKWPMPNYVEWADYVLLKTEQRDLMPYPNELYSLEGEDMLPDVIAPMSPKAAKERFLDRFNQLTS